LCGRWTTGRSEGHVPTRISEMNSSSSTNWLRCVHVEVVRTPAAAACTLEEDRDPAAQPTVRGWSRSKSNMATSRSKSTSIDDEDVDDDDGQTDAQSRSNNDEKVRTGGGDGTSVVVDDVRSLQPPNRSSSIEELVASSAGRPSVSGLQGPRSSVRGEGTGGRPSPASNSPGSSSRTDGDRHGVDGATTAAADRVGSAAEKTPEALTARRVLRMRTDRSRGGSRRRSDRVSGAAVLTLARLSSKTRRLS